MTTQMKPIDMTKDLEEAGWTRGPASSWQSPSGLLFRGPALAWHVMAGKPWQGEVICDHEWKHRDDSFSHEYGTEVIVYEECQTCGTRRPYEGCDE